MTDYPQGYDPDPQPTSEPPPVVYPTGFIATAPPPKKRTVWPWIVAGAILLVAVAGVVGFAVSDSTGSESSPTRPAALLPTSAATTTPAPAPTLDPKAACIRATGLIVDGTNIITEFVAHSDGSTLDRTKLATTIADMRLLQPSMPERLGDDLSDLAEPLEQLQDALTTGVNRTIETGIYRSRGPGLIIACGQYTQ